MPLLREWSIGMHALAAIWKIEEPESFFASHTGITSDIRNERRRVEHLAGRFLLQQLQQDFPILHIAKDSHDKPRIANNAWYFSISHSWPYVAAVLDPFQEAGIDIQTWHPRISTIKDKFLSVDEQLLMQADERLLTIAWTAKEAVYKWNGRRGVDFIEHMPITHLVQNELFANLSIFLNVFDVEKNISIETIISADFACSYVV